VDVGGGAQIDITELASARVVVTFQDHLAVYGCANQQPVQCAWRLVDSAGAVVGFPSGYSSEACPTNTPINTSWIVQKAAGTATYKVQHRRVSADPTQCLLGSAFPNDVELQYAISAMVFLD
jgi:hypothetical protein